MLLPSQSGYDDLMTEINLPPFMRPFFPDAKNLTPIRYEDGEYVVGECDNGSDAQTFSKLSEAMRYVHETLREDFDLSPLDGVEEGDTDDDLMDFIANSENIYPWSFPMTKYEQWKKTAAEYHLNPSDFWASFYFARNHPAFWSVDRGYWNFQREFTLEPASRKGDPDDKVWWCIESGGHVLPDCESFYHDTRVDAYGYSAEYVYIDLAKNVSEVFHDDGTERNPFAWE